MMMDSIVQDHRQWRPYFKLSFKPVQSFILEDLDLFLDLHTSVNNRLFKPIGRKT